MKPDKVPLTLAGGDVIKAEVHLTLAEALACSLSAARTPYWFLYAK